MNFVGDAGSTDNAVLDLVNSTIPLMAPLAGMVLTSRLGQQIVVLVYSVAYLAVEFNQLGVGG